MPYQANVICEECGEPFVARSSRAKFCPGGKCRKAANRRPSKKGKAASTVTPPLPGGLISQVASDLEKAKAMDTIPGRAALALAYRIESPMETGSAAASMTKELSRLVAEARAEVAPRLGDAGDDVEARVAAKLQLVR